MKHNLKAIKADLQSRGIDVLRFVYSDVIGVCRSKDVLVSQLEKSAENGPAFCEGVWVTNTRGDVLDAGNIAADGLQDMVGQLDPETITPMPWEPGVAYVVIDSLKPDGTANMFSPREVLRKVVESYHAIGLKPVVGPELEFYIANRLAGGGFERSLSQTGRVYTTGALVDPHGTFLHLMRMLDQMDIGVFAGNHEFSPSQYEINLWHSEALDAADRTFLFKTAIKDVVHRTGHQADRWRRSAPGLVWAERAGAPRGPSEAGGRTPRGVGLGGRGAREARRAWASPRSVRQGSPCDPDRRVARTDRPSAGWRRGPPPRGRRRAPPTRALLGLPQGRRSTRCRRRPAGPGWEDRRLAAWAPPPRLDEAAAGPSRRPEHQGGASPSV